jgi:hypothetical protein
MWGDDFMMGLDNIFRIAKWRIITQEHFIPFKLKLFPIFEAVGDLKLALGEKATSIDLEVNVIRPGVPFDYRWMQDVYGDSSPQLEEFTGEFEVVAGMTGIGLKKIVRLPSGDEMFESVLAPEVILASTLRQEGLYPWDDEDQGMSSPSKTPPPLKQVITTTNKILFDNRSHSSGFTKNRQTIATDNEQELLSATRAILDGTGAAPMITVINRVLGLHKEIDKTSNLLAENVRHTSYELFQQELDVFFQDSKRAVGTRLSKFLHKHSEEEELSESLIKITTQICMVSFCVSEWGRYLDPKLHGGEYEQLARFSLC